MQLILIHLSIKRFGDQGFANHTQVMAKLVFGKFDLHQTHHSKFFHQVSKSEGSRAEDPCKKIKLKNNSILFNIAGASLTIINHH